jgi:rhodanese-related sulfurtransferase
MKTKHVFFAAFLYMQMIGCTAQEQKAVTASAFEKMLQSTDSVQLLDVRTAAEYNSGHINHALWADWNNSEEFARRSAFLNKQKPVLVYCLAGGRSAAAAAQLRKAGYQVTELKGGINAWRALEKPLVGEADTPQMTPEVFNSSVATGTVLVDFGAAWCPPCKLMEPTIDSLQKELGAQFSLLKVDGGRDVALMKAWEVTALPVFIVFKNGKPVWRREGIATLAELKASLK